MTSGLTQFLSRKKFHAKQICVLTGFMNMGQGALIRISIQMFRVKCMKHRPFTKPWLPHQIRFRIALLCGWFDKCVFFAYMLRASDKKTKPAGESNARGRGFENGQKFSRC